LHRERGNADGHAQGPAVAVVSTALLVVADGQPIVWCAKLFGATGEPERVTGIDLLEALCRRAANDGTRVHLHLLGSTPPLVARAVARLRE
jgi:N-acetylglucosaminyldiphosphoundecaprenol N-acetyl-beta-D-mannosaminyltransferase